jgi:hypothetical protein
MGPRFDLRRVVLSAADGVSQLMHQLQGRAVVSVRWAIAPLCNERALLKSENVFRPGLSRLGAFDALLHLVLTPCHDVLRASFKSFQNRKGQERYCGNGKDSLKQWRCGGPLALGRTARKERGQGQYAQGRRSPISTEMVSKACSNNPTAKD